MLREETNNLEKYHCQNQQMFFTKCIESPQLGNSTNKICAFGDLCHKNDSVWVVVMVTSRVFALIIALDNVTSVLLIAQDV